MLLSEILGVELDTTHRWAILEVGKSVLLNLSDTGLANRLREAEQSAVAFDHNWLLQIPGVINRHLLHDARPAGLEADWDVDRAGV